MSCTILRRLNILPVASRSNCVLRLLSSECASTKRKPESRCRISEDDPVNHSWEHEGHFYVVPPSVCTQLFKHGGIPKSYQTQNKTFGETGLMIRKPALEIMNCMKSADYSRPVTRYLLFGEPGNGKSLSLAHVLHYGLNTGHLILHVPWVPQWTRRCQDHCPSEIKEGFRDTPIDSAAWLVHFKNQNQHILSQPDLTVAQKYIWSKREETLPGAPLLELVELGISRVKYASNIILAIAAEVKNLSTNGRCKTLVVVDGFNCFFNERTEIKDENWNRVTPSQLTVTEAFMELTKYDWCNGSVVVTVDQLIWPRDTRRASDFPLYQLGEKAFEHLDPFVPIHVQGYSEREFHSCIDYYVDREWIQNEKSSTEAGRDELLYLSTGNPYQLMNLCGPL